MAPPPPSPVAIESPVAAVASQGVVVRGEYSHDAGKRSYRLYLPQVERCSWSCTAAHSRQTTLRD
jgi:hypothetical protein